MQQVVHGDNMITRIKNKNSISNKTNISLGKNTIKILVKLIKILLDKNIITKEELKTIFHHEKKR